MKKLINKKMIKILVISFIFVGIIYLIDYTFYKPTKFNAFIASKIYKSPANPAFEDENFYKCVIDVYNDDNNASKPYTANLTDSQLLKIKNIYCLEKKISSVVGIEKISNLTELNLPYNQLTEIDLSGVPNLTKLNLPYNQLTEIDLSGVPNLTKLNLSDNQLTSIDLSKVPNLTDLDLEKNQLTSIDLSGVPNLTELYLPDNQLTDIDLSKVPNLISLHLGDNQLTEIDLSKVPNLTYLSLYHNQLTEIDLSGVPNLTYLNLNHNQLTNVDLSKNTKLEKLYLYNNQISSIDLSKVPNLTYLYLDNNQLTEIDLSKVSNLKYLNLMSNQLTTIDLSKVPNLEKLNLGYNQLTEIDLSGVPNLTELYLNNNQLTSIDLSKVSNLKYLNLMRNQLTTIDLSGVPNLTELRLSSNQLTEIDLSKVPNLTDLDLDNNPLTDDIYIYLNESKIISNNIITNSNTRVEYAISDKLNFNINNNSIKPSELGTFKVEVGYYSITDDQFLFISYYVYVIQATSDKYVINEENNYIYTGQDTDPNTILDNINVNYGTKKIIDNKLVIIANNKIVKEFDIISINSKYTINDQNNCIFVGTDYNYPTAILNNIKLNSGTREIVDNKLVIKIDGQVIKEFDIVGISSDTYMLNQRDNYLYVKDGIIDISKLTALNGELNLNNDNLEIKHNNQVVYSYKIVGISSDKYIIDDKEKNIVVPIDTDPNTILNNINISYGTKQILGDNLLAIYADGKTVYSFTLIKINSDKYDLSKEYIYTKLDDIDIDNITLNLGRVELNDNNLEVKVYSKPIHTYKIINISSDKYDLSKDYIYDKSGIVDINKINITNGELNINNNNNKLEVKYNNKVIDTYDIITVSSNNSNVNYHLKEEDFIFTRADVFNINELNITNGEVNLTSDNKLEIKYGNEVLNTYDIVSLSSDIYNLNKFYIYTKDNTLDINKINITNGELNIKDNELEVKYNGDVIYGFLIVSISSDEYEIGENYIYTGIDNLRLDKIKITNGNLEILYNNKLGIIFNGNLIDTYDIMTIRSSYYDLRLLIDKGYIYTGIENLDKTKINITSGELNITEDNKLEIKHGDTIIREYDVITVSSDKYILNDEYIYTINDIDYVDILNNIKISNAEYYIQSNMLIIEYHNPIFQILESIRTYPICNINFSDLEVFDNKITISEDISYEDFTRKITTNRTSYKIFNGDNEVREGNMENGMLLKVYRNNTLLETYEITNEFLVFDSSLNINENKKSLKNTIDVKVSDIISNIDTSGNVSIINNKNQVISGNTKIGTGYKLRIELKNEVLEYTFIIKGDITGTGNITMSDVMKSASHIFDNNTITGSEYLEAADITGDGKIKMNDVMKLATFVLEGGSL